MHQGIQSRDASGGKELCGWAGWEGSLSTEPVCHSVQGSFRLAEKMKNSFQTPPGDEMYPFLVPFRFSEVPLERTAVSPVLQGQYTE